MTLAVALALGLVGSCKEDASGKGQVVLDISVTQEAASKAGGGFVTLTVVARSQDGSQACAPPWFEHRNDEGAFEWAEPGCRAHRWEFASGQEWHRRVAFQPGETYGGDLFVWVEVFPRKTEPGSGPVIAYRKLFAFHRQGDAWDREELSVPIDAADLCDSSSGEAGGVSGRPRPDRPLDL